MAVVGPLSSVMSGYYPLLIYAASTDPLPTMTYIHFSPTY